MLLYNNKKNNRNERRVHISAMLDSNSEDEFWV